MIRQPDGRVGSTVHAAYLLHPDLHETGGIGTEIRHTPPIWRERGSECPNGVVRERTRLATGCIDDPDSSAVLAARVARDECDLLSISRPAWVSHLRRRKARNGDLAQSPRVNVQKHEVAAQAFGGEVRERTREGHDSTIR